MWKHFRHHPAMIPNISLGCCGSHLTISSSVGFPHLPTLLWVTKDWNLHFPGSLPSGFQLHSIRVALAGERTWGRGKPSVFLPTFLCFELCLQQWPPVLSGPALQGKPRRLGSGYTISSLCPSSPRDDSNFLLLLISGLPPHLLFSSLFLQYLSNYFQTQMLLNL